MRGCIRFESAEKHGIQRYGFHGASHRYVMERVHQIYPVVDDQLKLISCHLGGSSSLCAVRDHHSVDCSLGFTPQTGIFHGTRIGEMDPFAVFYVMQEEGLSLDEVNQVLTRESGLLGLSGVSEDMRDIENAMLQGNSDAQLAFDAFVYQIKIYWCVLRHFGWFNVVAFAGGIGECSWRVQKRSVRSGTLGDWHRHR